MKWNQQIRFPRNFWPYLKACLLVLLLYIVIHVFNMNLGGYDCKLYPSESHPWRGGLSTKSGIKWMPRYGRMDLQAPIWELVVYEMWEPIMKIDRKLFNSHESRDLFDDDFQNWINTLPKYQVHPRCRHLIKEAVK